MFCNYNCKHIGVVGVLGYGLVTGILYVFGIVTEMLHSFGSDNSKCRMSCSCIGMRFVTGMLYVLVIIFEGIGHGNIIHFCYYNNNRSSGSWSDMNEISNGNVIGFWFSFWYMFGNI